MLSSNTGAAPSSPTAETSKPSGLKAPVRSDPFCWRTIIPLFPVATSHRRAAPGGNYASQISGQKPASSKRTQSGRWLCGCPCRRRDIEGPRGVARLVRREPHAIFACIKDIGRNRQKARLNVRALPRSRLAEGHRVAMRANSKSCCWESHRDLAMYRQAVQECTKNPAVTRPES